jgi:iron(III) transport system permease protein
LGEAASLSASARFPRDPIALAIRALVAVAVFLLAVPIFALLSSSLSDVQSNGSTLTLANFEAVLAHPLFAPVAWNTLMLGAGTVAVMLLFAVPFAWLFARSDLPRKDLLLALITVNVAIPSFLVAIGYIFLFNPSNGLANQLARDAFGLTNAPFNIYSLGWMIVLQGTALAAPAFFMIVPCLQAIDVTLEEAASASGVRLGATALRIVLPLAAPAILAACAYYFIIAIEMFDYASMLGMPARIFVASTWLYQMINAGTGLPRYGEAAALGLLVAVGSLLVSLVYLWSINKAARYTVVTGKRRRHHAVRLDTAAKIIAWAFVFAYAVFSFVLPVLTLLWASGQPFMQLPTPDALSRWSFEAYHEAFAQLPPLLYNNLVVMLAVPTISVALAACVAWAGTHPLSTWDRGRLARFLARAGRAGRPPSQVTRGPRRGLDLFVMMAIAVPSIVGALGFLYFGLAIYRAVPIYTTVWLIVLAMSTRYLTWANRTISSNLLQVHPEIEEACATSGVRPGPAFVSVLLPTIGRALIYSWFWLALLSLRELTIPIMLARPDTAVMATAIWSLNAAGNADVAAAMSMILVSITLVMVFFFHKVAGQREI